MRKLIRGLSLCIWAGITAVHAQNNEAYPFLHTEQNTISEAKALAPFFEKLARSKDSVISIVHIGDSHIQADYFSGKLRTLLQDSFGNAGRGLVFPYRLAKTNGPNDYFFFSNETFTSLRIVKADSPSAIGLSGINLYREGNTEISFRLRNADADRNYGFNNVMMICTTQDSSCRIILRDSAANELEASTMQDSAGQKQIAFHSPNNLSALNVSVRNNSGNFFTLNGMVLSNGNKGILYHAIGVNGATFKNYTGAPLFFEQLKQLKPDLVIVSLGTNESVSDIDENILGLYISVFVQQLKQVAPNTSVLFTMPADNFTRHAVTVRSKKKKRKSRRVVLVNNTKVQMIRRVEADFCKTSGAAYWDLYEVMGGEKSMKKWAATGLAAKDHIHFSKKGYELQAELLFDALLKSYFARP